MLWCNMVGDVLCGGVCDVVWLGVTGYTDQRYRDRVVRCNVLLCSDERR